MLVGTAETAEPGGTPGAPAMEDPSTLLFRGQFLLGPGPFAPLPRWSRISVAPNCWLTSHPDLTVTQVTDGRRGLTLIGFMLDPANPLADDHAVLTRLLSSCDSRRSLIRATHRLGGRWVLVGACDDGLYLFGDALGLRQAFHTDRGIGSGVWVMSQPGLAVDLLGMPLDAEAARFLDSYIMRSRAESRWPGTATPVRGLRHLLPNHVLNLQNGEVARFWPDRRLPSVSLDQGVRHIMALLPAMLQAAAARFDLVLSVTAGLDSRLVLAAARPLRERVSCVTLRQARMDDGSDDLSVPARLLRHLGVPHEIVRANGSMSADFSWAFKRSVFHAHDHYGPDAEAILERFGRRKVVVTGSGAEVGRCSFRKDLPFGGRGRIDAHDLAWLQHMEHPFALRYFQEWLDGARRCHDVKLLDLFEWEQGHGNWLAMTQLEFDIAWRDIFTPYNCRELLTTLLAVGEEFRRAPAYTLFNLATRKLWPEVLTEPINPSSQSMTLRHWMNLARNQLRVYARAF